jgi:hypothetical protein
MLLFLALALSTLQAPSGRHAVTGSVRDAATGERLAAANVRIPGTSRGTITNTDGRFSLLAQEEENRLIISMLGYRTDTLEVPSGRSLDVRLTPAAIEMAEVVVSSEDPALEIIRRAIASKQKWFERLHSYEMHAFTRQTVYRDTAVAAINESYTTGYWQQGDTLREIVTQRRQTANVPSAFNFASVGQILNFAQDEIRFFGYAFVGPTALDALDYYDYTLLRTMNSYGQEIYEIRMSPRTRTVPLFQGTIMIAGGSYALMGVDVTPNAAFRIPFVTSLHLRYRQQFGLYESTFWMPADIRIEGDVSIGIVGIHLPAIGFTQTSVISDYAINAAIPDTIFRKPRLVVDSSAVRFDSTYWAANAVLPMSPLEQRAYKTLDSTQTLDVQFRPSGAAITLGEGTGGIAGTILSHADIFFNRVEGLHLGARIALDSLFSSVAAHAGLSYGFSDRRGKYILGAMFFTEGRRTFGLGAEVYRRDDHRPDEGYYDPLFNSLTALLAKNDYQDYHRVEGGRASVLYSPSPRLSAELSYVAETHRFAPQTTDFSIFYRNDAYRPNPEAAEGNLRSLRLDARIGPRHVPLDFLLANAFDLSVEHASPSLTGGDFSFTRADGVLSLNIPTIGQSFLLRPGFRIRAAAGASTGSLPPQRLFDIETSSGGYAPLGVMRAMDVKEFAGTGYAALSVEHNFRTLPFLALGIPFLYENGIEFILYGGGARSWSEGRTPAPPVTDGWYYESGFAISRIFDLLRADFTWRIGSPAGFRFTLGAAPIL